MTVIARAPLLARLRPLYQGLDGPLLLACLHQDQLEGAHLRAMNLEKLIASTCGAFLRAFATSPPVWGTDEPPEPVLAAADWR